VIDPLVIVFGLEVAITRLRAREPEVVAA